MAAPDDAFADAQREILKRVRRYKNAPSIAALEQRLGRYCGGADAVDAVVISLVKSGQLRVTNKIFYIPSVWDNFFADLG